MKRVAKGLLLFIGTTAYVWLLLLSAGAFELRQSLSEPHTLKSWLSNSGVYGGVVDEVSKLATIQQKQENSLVQITAEDINQVARDTFPSDGIKMDSENVIDGFYGWLKGEASSPQFSVDFTSRQAAFAKEMTDKLETKINALPECATTGRFSIQAFDPFKADCRPKGADVTAELTSFEKDLAVSKDILPNTIFSAGDIKLKDAQGQQVGVESAVPWAPRAYKALVWGPWLVLVLTIVAGLSLIFLSSSRRKGLKRFAGGLLFVGIVMLASGFLSRPAFERLNNWSSKSIGAEVSITENIINPLFSQMNTTYSKYNIIVGTAYLIPALVTYAALLITRHKEESEELAEEITVEEPRSTKGPEENPDPTAQSDLQPEDQIDAVNKEMETKTVGLQPQYQPPRQSAQPIARPTQRPVTRRPPMIQG